MSGASASGTRREDTSPDPDAGPAHDPPMPRWADLEPSMVQLAHQFVEGLGTIWSASNTISLQGYEDALYGITSRMNKVYNSDNENKATLKTAASMIFDITDEDSSDSESDPILHRRPRYRPNASFWGFTKKALSFFEREATLRFLVERLSFPLEDGEVMPLTVTQGVPEIDLIRLNRAWGSDYGDFNSGIRWILFPCSEFAPIPDLPKESSASQSSSYPSATQYAFNSVKLKAIKWLFAHFAKLHQQAAVTSFLRSCQYGFQIPWLPYPVENKLALEANFGSAADVIDSFRQTIKKVSRKLEKLGITMDDVQDGETLVDIVMSIFMVQICERWMRDAGSFLLMDPKSGNITTKKWLTAKWENIEQEALGSSGVIFASSGVIPTMLESFSIKKDSPSYNEFMSYSSQLIQLVKRCE
ncbi:hypothetical protein BJ508DRAFT_53989 [Ascobolus immersus RN42]|uniref:Uncharacterized protein n=1 Tax=Ascobolus immersus RN42 TaxID=1160509 RepID=A0A3N4HJX3_ASCIM|nr:hypothetical protein BJ508DRAFT_53989 [Ascobolus immersus RN42]